MEDVFEGKSMEVHFGGDTPTEALVSFFLISAETELIDKMKRWDFVETRHALSLHAYGRDDVGGVGFQVVYALVEALGDGHHASIFTN